MQNSPGAQSTPSSISLTFLGKTFFKTHALHVVACLITENIKITFFLPCRFSSLRMIKLMLANTRIMHELFKARNLCFNKNLEAN